MLLSFQFKLATVEGKLITKEGNISLLTSEHDIALKISIYVDASTQNRIEVYNFIIKIK